MKSEKVITYEEEAEGQGQVTAQGSRGVRMVPRDASQAPIRILSLGAGVQSTTLALKANPDSDLSFEDYVAGFKARRA